MYVVYLSFHKVNLFTNSFTFVGLDNYLRLFTDETARKALTNTLSFSVVVVPCQTVIALIIASVLNSKIRGKYFFRAVYFLPTLTSSSALTIIFMFMFSVTGPINMMLIRAGILPVGGGINFLENPDFALKVIMVMNIWSTVPQYTTMYLASLQDLPVSLYEAAEIDGLSRYGVFFRIAMPLARPTIATTAIFGFMGFWNAFTAPMLYIKTASKYTLTLGLQSFQSQNAGTMWNQVMAAACISVLPIILLYLIFNKFFMVGLRMDGEK